MNMTRTAYYGPIVRFNVDVADKRYSLDVDTSRFSEKKQKKIALKLLVKGIDADGLNVFNAHPSSSDIA